MATFFSVCRKRTALMGSIAVLAILRVMLKLQLLLPIAPRDFNEISPSLSASFRLQG